MTFVSVFAGLGVAGRGVLITASTCFSSLFSPMRFSVLLYVLMRLLNDYYYTWPVRRMAVLLYLHHP